MSSPTNTPEKIIIISPAFPYRGGIAATTDRLAKEYSQRGETVEIWTYKMLYPKIIFPGKSQYLDLEKHNAPEGITIHRKISSVNPFNWIKVGRQLKKANAKKVIIRYWLPFLGPCLGSIIRFAKNGKTIFVGLIDNVSPHESRFGDKMLSKYFYKKLDGFLVMSKKGIHELQAKFKIQNKITYSPHPLFDIYGDPMDKAKAYEKLNLDPNLNYILSFGLIRKYKGVDLLIRAFHDFSEQHPNHRLLIVGECYGDWATYQSLIDELDLNDKVIRFDSFIPDAEVKYYFSAADFLALTYRTATQSGVTQIAYSMELPILVTNVGDLATMVTDGKVGRVVEAGNNQAIVDAMKEMSVSAQIAHYKAGIAEEKKRFEWSVLCDNLDQL
ncbi:MAG: glycosyltransferase [Crocinitomix sp.]|nr:glycosyltransferase [Crocinitomix sp.]